MDLNTLHTKYGTAKKDWHGYYIITSRKEGNHLKSLHRLIWEDFYGFKVPKDYHIHHKNANKLDNCILNLQLLKEHDHQVIHNQRQEGFHGKTHSLENRLKMSKSKNTTGYYRVTKLNTNKYSQGFCFAYQWINEDKKTCRIKAESIDKLKEKVLAKGLEWIEY